MVNTQVFFKKHGKPKIHVFFVENRIISNVKVIIMKSLVIDSKSQLVKYFYSETFKSSVYYSFI